MPVEWLVYGKPFNATVGGVFGDYKILLATPGINQDRKRLTKITSGLLKGVDPNQLTGEGFSYSASLEAWNGSACALYRSSETPEIEMSGRPRNSHFLQAAIGLVAEDVQVEPSGILALWASLANRLRELLEADITSVAESFTLDILADGTNARVAYNREPDIVLNAAVMCDACVTEQRVVLPLTRTGEKERFLSLEVAYSFLPPMHRRRLSFGGPVHQPHNSILTVCFAEGKQPTNDISLGPYGKWVLETSHRDSHSEIELIKRKLFRKLEGGKDPVKTLAAIHLFAGIREMSADPAREQVLALWQDQGAISEALLGASIRRVVSSQGIPARASLITDLLRCRRDNLEAGRLSLIPFIGQLIDAAEQGREHEELEKLLVPTLAESQNSALARKVLQNALRQGKSEQAYWLFSSLLRRSTSWRSSAAVSDMLAPFIASSSTDWWRICAALCEDLALSSMAAAVLAAVAAEKRADAKSPLALFYEVDTNGTLAVVEKSIETLVDKPSMAPVVSAAVLAHLSTGRIVGRSQTVIRRALDALTREQRGEQLLERALIAAHRAESQSEARTIEALLEVTLDLGWWGAAVLIDTWLFKRGIEAGDRNQRWKKEAAASKALGALMALVEAEGPFNVLVYISPQLDWLVANHEWPRFMDAVETASKGSTRQLSEYAGYRSRLEYAKQRATIFGESRFLDLLSEVLRTSEAGRRRGDERADPTPARNAITVPSSPEEARGRLARAKAWLGRRLRKRSSD